MSLRTCCMRLVVWYMISQDKHKPLTVMDLRKRIGLTQEEMARRLGRSLSSVAKMEAGRAPRLYPWEIPEFLTAYECTLAEFSTAFPSKAESA
jgi:uncharacterized small protein (DUF1192 family)